jgi:hypothetical protein
MKLSAQQRAQRLHPYGLVHSMSYVVRLNGLKTAQHLRAKLAWVLRRPHNLANPLYDVQTSRDQVTNPTIDPSYYPRLKFPEVTGPAGNITLNTEPYG